MNNYDIPRTKGVTRPEDLRGPKSVTAEDSITTAAADRVSQGLTTLCESILRCTAGRPHATTGEFSHLTGKAPQTIRKNYSQTGACFGIRPIKVGNSLLWPVEGISRLLVEGGCK